MKRSRSVDTVDKRKQTEFENLETALAGRTPGLSGNQPHGAGSCIKYPGSRGTANPEITPVGNAKTFPMLKLYFDLDTSRARRSREGDTPETGTHEMTFIMAPMAHCRKLW